jgi:hypothetical protein
MIVKRYLPRQRQLAREALARLAEEDNPDPDAAEEAHTEAESKMEEPTRLWQQRMGAVVAVLKSQAQSAFGPWLRRRETAARIVGGQVISGDRRDGRLLSQSLRSPVNGCDWTGCHR